MWHFSLDVDTRAIHQFIVKSLSNTVKTLDVKAKMLNFKIPASNTYSIEILMLKYLQ